MIHTLEIAKLLLIIALSQTDDSAIAPRESIRAASPTLTLENCLLLAEKLNLGYQRLKSEERLEKPVLRAAYGNFLPSVQVGYTLDQTTFYNPTYLNPDGTISTFPRSIPVFDTYIDTAGYYLRVDPTTLDTVLLPVPQGGRRNSMAFLRVEEILFDGGRSWLNLKNARIRNEMRIRNLDSKRFDLRRDVTKAYTDAIAAQRKLELIQQLLEQRHLQLELAEARYTAGSVTRRDVLQAEVDLGRAVSDSLQAAFAVARTREALNLSMGLAIDSSYAISPLSEPFAAKWDADSLARIAIACRGEYRTAQSEVDLRSNESQSARGDQMPVVLANFSHNRSEQSGRNVPFTLQPRNRFTSVGVTVSWQLFDRFTRALKVQDSKVKLHQAELTVSELEMQIRREVFAALDQVKALHQQSLVARNNLRLADETLEFERERYRLGSASVLDLGAAQLSYSQAADEVIRVETEFHAALGSLERSVGVELR